MELNLHEHPSPPTVYSTGISVNNMSWWFWIKAGAGFMTGAATVGLVLSVLGWVMMVFFLGGLGLLLRR